MSSNTLKQAAEAARSKSNMGRQGTESSSSAVAAADFLHTPLVRAALPFVNGGLAGMTATTIIQPVDMIKVRLQLAGEGVATGPKPTPLSVTREILAQGRALDLYTGLSAGLLRQAVYTTARIGFFDTFMSGFRTRAKENGTQVGFAERAAAGLGAGGVAAFIGNPADLALIRMQSDGLKPADQRKHYRSVVDAVTRIVRSEGVGALWAGAAPTVVRAMALNFGQLAFFSEAKAQLESRAPAWSSARSPVESQSRSGVGSVSSASRMIPAGVSSVFAISVLCPASFVYPASVCRTTQHEQIPNTLRGARRGGMDRNPR